LSDSHKELDTWDGVGVFFFFSEIRRSVAPNLIYYHHIKIFEKKASCCVVRPELGSRTRNTATQTVNLYRKSAPLTIPNSQNHMKQ
jgi:hypothetical protein